MKGHKTYQLILLAAALIVAGCGQPPEGWTPVLEETSTAYLEKETERALDRVVSARRNLRADPDHASELLVLAEQGLRELRQVYLPILQARGRAYNAYRYHLLARNDDAAQELERIEDLLLEVGGGVEGALLAEIEHLQERVIDARLELRAGSEDIDRALRDMAEALDTFVTRSDFFL